MAIVDREEFDRALAEKYYLKSKSNRRMWNRGDIQRIINILLEIRSGKKKESVHYHHEKLYKLVSDDDAHYVAKKMQKLLFI